MLQALELELHLGAHLAVEGGERLVEQQQARALDDGAGECHPLALAAAELGRPTLREAGETNRVEDFPHAAIHLGFAHPLRLEAVGDVRLDAHVREEGVRLKHHIHRALVGWHRSEVDAVEQDVARGRRLKAGDRSQQRALATSGGSEQREELVIGDL